MESFIEVLEYLRTQVAPEVLKTGAQITFWNSITHMVYALFGVMGYPAFWFISKHIVRYFNDNEVIDRDDPLPIAMMFGVVISTVAAISATIQILNVWMWVGIFNPELAFARELFIKVFGG